MHRAGEHGLLLARDKAADVPTPLHKNLGGSLPNDAWLDFELIADGNNIVTRISGNVIAQATDARFRRGHIALEVWPKSVIRFKDLEIKELAPIETAWRPLFNGKDFDGWLGDLKTWKVENDNLIVQGSPVSFLRTARKDYKDLNLRLECWAEPDTKGWFNIHLFSGEDNTDGPYAALAFAPDGKGTMIAQHMRLKINRPATRSHDDTFRPGRWNPIEVRSVAGKIEVFSNGKIVGTLGIPDAKPGYLSINASAGWKFRKIEIKELPPTGTLTITNQHPTATAAVNVLRIDSKKGTWTLHDGVFLDAKKSWTLHLEASEYEIKVEGPKGQDPPDVIRRVQIREGRPEAFPESERPRIFETFYSTKPGGTGLGLAVVRRTIEDFGGRIAFESEVGQGTTFRIQLPAARSRRVVLDDTARQPVEAISDGIGT